MDLKKIVIYISISFSISACIFSVNHTGLGGAIGEEYDVGCDLVIRTGFGATRAEQVIDGSAQVCSIDEPGLALRSDACDYLASANRSAIEEDFVDVTSVVGVPNDDVAPVGAGDCFLPESGEPGTGVVIESLSPSGATISLLSDPEYQVRGRNSFNNTELSVISSTVKVGVKLLAWRYADTTVTGLVRLDRLNCLAEGDCDLALRSLDLKFEESKFQFWDYTQFHLRK